MMPPTHYSMLEAMKVTVTREQAFARFDPLYRPAIVAWCRRHGLQHAAAEDVTQIILHRLWVSLPKFEFDPAKGTFGSYLTRVANNAVADYFRQRQRHPQPEAVGGSTAHEMVHQVETPRGGEKVSDAASVEELMSEILKISTTTEWEAISRVKLKVQAQTWECFHLREVEAWPVEDVVKATGKREGAVYTAIYRIRKMIADEHQQVLREREQPSREDES